MPPQAVVAQHRLDLDGEPTIGIPADPVLKVVRVDAGQPAHRRAGRKAAEQARCIREPLPRPRPRDHRDLGQPDHRGQVIEEADFGGLSHGQSGREPVGQVRSVDERLGAPRHHSLGGLPVLVRDLGEEGRPAPRLGDLDEEPHGSLPRRSTDPGRHPPPARRRDGVQGVVDHLHRRAGQGRGVGVEPELADGEAEQDLVRNVRRAEQ